MKKNALYEVWRNRKEDYRVVTPLGIFRFKYRHLAQKTANSILGVKNMKCDGVIKIDLRQRNKPYYIVSEDGERKTPFLSIKQYQIVKESMKSLGFSLIDLTLKR